MSKPQLVIDLDGTLIRTDLLIESALALMKAKRVWPKGGGTDSPPPLPLRKGGRINAPRPSLRLGRRRR